MSYAKINQEIKLKGPQYKIFPIRLTTAGGFSDKKINCSEIKKTIRPKGPYGR